MNTLKITQSQNLILQSILGILLSSAISAISAVAQYILRGGHVDVGVAVSIGVAAFATIFGASLRAYVPTHIKEVLQAKDDTIAQLTQRAQVAEQRVQAQPDVQAALSQIAQQQHASTQNMAQQVAQSVTESVQKTIATALPAQPVTINVTTPTAPVSVATPDVLQPPVQVAPVQQPTPPATPDVSQVATASIPVVPTSVPNPLADFTSSNPLNDDTLTAVQVASARRVS